MVLAIERLGQSESEIQSVLFEYSNHGGMWKPKKVSSFVMQLYRTPASAKQKKLLIDIVSISDKANDRTRPHNPDRKAIPSLWNKLWKF